MKDEKRRFKEFGSYPQMHKTAYDEAYKIIWDAFLKAMGDEVGDKLGVWASINGVNDAIFDASKLWLTKHLINIRRDDE